MTIYEQKIAKTKKADQKTAREAAERCYRFGRDIDDIYKAYGRPSLKKVQAWERCRRICEELDGYDMRIAGKGAYSFSVVFKFFDKENYKQGYAYITKDYDRFCWA